MSAVASLNATSSPPKSGALWAGRIAGALPALAMILSGAMKLSHSPKVVDMFVHKFGYSEGSLLGIGILELTCVLVYLVPRTTFLGSVLMTAYLGGAVATHVRVSDAFVIPVVLGVLVWVGLYLREPRLRALAPLRT
jgi:DoxX-like protein